MPIAVVFRNYSSGRQERIPLKKIPDKVWMFTFKIVVTDECPKKWGSLYDSVNIPFLTKTKVVAVSSMLL